MSRDARKQTLWFPTRSNTNWLYSHRSQRWAGNFGFRKLKNCIIHVAKPKALIRFAITAKLICVFVFAYAKCLLSHDAAHIFMLICFR